MTVKALIKFLQRVDDQEAIILTPMPRGYKQLKSASTGVFFFRRKNRWYHQLPKHNNEQEVKDTVVLF